MESSRTAVASLTLNLFRSGDNGMVADNELCDLLMFNTSNWIRGGCRNVPHLFVTSPALPLFHCKVHCTVPCVRSSFALMNSQWIESQLIRIYSITATLQVSRLIVFWVALRDFACWFYLEIVTVISKFVFQCSRLFYNIRTILHHIVHSFARIYVGSFGCFHYRISHLQTSIYVIPTVLSTKECWCYYIVCDKQSHLNVVCVGMLPNLIVLVHRFGCGFHSF